MSLFKLTYKKIIFEYQDKLYKGSIYEMPSHYMFEEETSEIRLIRSKKDVLLATKQFYGFDILTYIYFFDNVLLIN